MNTELHIPLHQVYVGLEASATLQEIKEGASKEEIEKFLTSCKNFLIECILQIQKRFDLKAEYHEIVECRLPSIAASLTPRSLKGICEKLPYLCNILDLGKLDMEWRQQALEEKSGADLQWCDY